MVRGNGTAGAESPESQWACDGFTDREEEESRGSEVTGGHPRVTAERERTSETEREKTEGDLLFAQKCAELQGFVRPLLELLNGLKGGRFDRGLSSFQQTAAMDRIQRIVGILRRPNIGEKYMNTLLQVETMLKMWFPQVSPLAPPIAPTLFPPHLSPRDSPSMPILSPWKPMEGKQLLPVMPPPTTRGSPAMQDSVISSTTPFNNFQSQQQPIGCQSQPVAGKTGKNTLKTCQGRVQAHSIMAKPLKRVECKSRVNPAPL
uniref:Circadian associated repressor of transcription a n=1 Tax=Hucho hucho TaxID=62062 RepID=A0A4W5PXU2_9TELE